MNTETELHISPIFSGLTRPPMFSGITVDYLFICFLLSYGAFMLTANPLFIIIYAPLHIFGWIACKFDHHYFRVLMKKIECPNTRNKKIWGVQTYEPF